MLLMLCKFDYILGQTQKMDLQTDQQTKSIFLTYAPKVM